MTARISFHLLAVSLAVAFPTGCVASGAASLSSLFADAVSQKWPAGRTPLGAGTAAASDPYVLTAAHVIAGCRHVRVSRAGALRPATLVGLDSRLDLALLIDTIATSTAATSTAGSKLADVLDADESQQARLHGLQIVGFGQPGHNTNEPVRVAVQSPGLVQGMAEAPLLSLSGPLVAGTSGSPVLGRDGRSIGMVVGQIRADREHGVGVRSADLLRFLAYFGIIPEQRQSSQPVAQAVLVQCAD